MNLRQSLFATEFLGLSFISTVVFREIHRKRKYFAALSIAVLTFLCSAANAQSNEWAWMGEAVWQEISLHMAPWACQAMEVFPAVERSLSVGKTKRAISGYLVAQDSIRQETPSI